MELEEFLQKIDKLDVCFYEKNKNKHQWSREDYSYKSNRVKNPLVKEDFLYENWTIGGVGGGSCWDDGTRDNHYARSGEQEPNFIGLDIILENLCPDVSFIKYKKLTNEIIKYSEYSIGEYYGNSTNYRCKFINLEDLYNKLKEMSLI